MEATEKSQQFRRQDFGILNSDLRGGSKKPNVGSTDIELVPL
jgi:hypothetical protein